MVYNAAFEAAGVDAVYVALEPPDIGAAMAAVRSLGLGGGTVTAPFKQEVVKHLDEVDEHATAIGAVNVVVHRDGRLIGHNSDWLGALAALREVVEPAGRQVALSEFDVVVRPRVTLLAGEHGCVIVPGIAMVAHQAVPALEWLTGVRPDVTLLRERFG